MNSAHLTVVAFTVTKHQQDCTLREEKVQIENAAGVLTCNIMSMEQVILRRDCVKH